MFHFSDLTTFIPRDTTMTLESALAALQDVPMTSISMDGPSAERFTALQREAHRALTALYQAVSYAEQLLADAANRSTALVNVAQRDVDKLQDDVAATLFASENRLTPSQRVSLSPQMQVVDPDAYGTLDMADVTQYYGVTCGKTAHMLHTRVANMAAGSLTVLHRVGLPLPVVEVVPPSALLVGGKIWSETILAPAPIVSVATWLPTSYRAGAAVQLLLTLEMAVAANRLTLAPCAPHPVKILQVDVLDESGTASTCWSYGDACTTTADLIVLELHDEHGTPGCRGRRFVITIAQEHYDFQTVSIPNADEANRRYWQQAQPEGILAPVVMTGVDGLATEDVFTSWERWVRSTQTALTPELESLISRVGTSLTRVAELFSQLTSPQGSTQRTGYSYTYGFQSIQLACDIFADEGWYLSTPIDVPGDLRQVRMLASVGRDDVVTTVEDLFPGQDLDVIGGLAANTPAEIRGHVTGWLALTDLVEGPKLPLVQDAWTLLDPQRMRALDISEYTLTSLAPDQTRSTAKSGYLYATTADQTVVLEIAPGCAPRALPYLYRDHTGAFKRLDKAWSVATDEGTDSEPSQLYLRRYDNDPDAPHSTIYELYSGSGTVTSQGVETFAIAATAWVTGETASVLTCEAIPETLDVGAAGTYVTSDGTTYTVWGVDREDQKLSIMPALPEPTVTFADYGQPIEGAGAANYPNLRYGYRFGASFCPDKSGTVTSLALQWKTATGYGAGTYGRHRFEIRENNPATNFPSSVILASVDIDNLIPYISGPLPAKGGALTIPLTAILVAGTVYHVVCRNIDNNPYANWSSPNTLLTRVETLTLASAQTGRASSSVDGLSWHSWTDPNNPWDPNNGGIVNGSHTPVELNWSDGTHSGDPYYCSLSGENNDGRIYGTRRVGERITWTKPTVSVESLRVSVKKIGHPADDLCISFAELDVDNEPTTWLISGDTTLAAEGDVSGSAQDWITYTFAVPVLLEEGHTYQFWLSSPGATALSYYKTYPCYGESQPSHWLENGWGGTQSCYAFSNDSGVTFETWGNADLTFVISASLTTTPLDASVWSFSQGTTRETPREPGMFWRPVYSDDDLNPPRQFLARKYGESSFIAAPFNNQYRGSMYPSYSSYVALLTREDADAEWVRTAVSSQGRSSVTPTTQGVVWTSPTTLAAIASGDTTVIDAYGVQYPIQAASAIGGSTTAEDLLYTGTATGEVYVHEKQVIAELQAISSVATSAPALPGGMVQSGALYYVVDPMRACLQVLRADGTSAGWIGLGLGPNNTTAEGLHQDSSSMAPLHGDRGGALWDPWGIAVLADQSLLVADTHNRRLVNYATTGECIRWFGTSEDPLSAESVGVWHANSALDVPSTAIEDVEDLSRLDSTIFYAPTDVVVGYSHTGAQYILVLDIRPSGARLVVLDSAGTRIFAHDLPELQTPKSLACLDAGAGQWTLAITDTEAHRVCLYAVDTVMETLSFSGWFGSSTTHTGVWHDTTNTATTTGLFTRPLWVAGDVVTGCLYVSDSLQNVAAFRITTHTQVDTALTATALEVVPTATGNDLVVLSDSLERYHSAAASESYVSLLLLRAGEPITQLVACGTNDTATLYALTEHGALYRAAKSESNWIVDRGRHLGRGFTLLGLHDATAQVFAANADGYLYHSTDLQQWSWSTETTGAAVLPALLREETFAVTDPSGAITLTEWPYLDWEALHTYHTQNYPYSIYNPNDPSLPLLVPFTVEVILKDGTFIPADTLGDTARIQGLPHFYTIPSTINTLEDTSADRATFTSLTAACSAMPLTVSDSSLLTQNLSQLRTAIPEIEIPLRNNDTREVQHVTDRRIYRSLTGMWMGDTTFKVGLVLPDANGVERLYYAESATHTLVTTLSAGNMTQSLFPTARAIPQGGLVVFDTPLPENVVVREDGAERVVSLTRVELVLFDFYAPANIIRVVGPDGVASYLPQRSQAVPCTVNLTDYLRGECPDVSLLPYNHTVDVNDPAYYPILAYTQQGRTLRFNHVFAAEEGATIRVRYWTMALHPRLLVELHRTPTTVNARQYTPLASPTLTGVTLLTGCIQ